WVFDKYILSILVSSSQSLGTLKLPRSWISDSTVKDVAPRLSTIKYLDVRHCGNIGAPALEAIGNSCRHLIRLDRTVEEHISYSRSIDEEATAIAATMPKLKHLEIGYMRVSTQGVLNILSGCPELEVLDIRGCRKVKLDDIFVQKVSSLKVFGPQLDCYDDPSHYFYRWRNVG
ncbi:LRR domain containing protein, partial [Trema orientale]